MKARELDRQRRIALHNLLAQPQFRMWVRGVLEQCNAEGPTFGEGHRVDDVLWREGRRSIGIQIRTEAEEVSTRNFVLLLEEGYHERGEYLELEHADEDTDGAEEAQENQG